MGAQEGASREVKLGGPLRVQLGVVQRIRVTFSNTDNIESGSNNGHWRTEGSLTRLACHFTFVRSLNLGGYSAKSPSKNFCRR